MSFWYRILILNDDPLGNVLSSESRNRLDLFLVSKAFPVFIFILILFRQQKFSQIISFKNFYDKNSYFGQHIKRI